MKNGVRVEFLSTVPAPHGANIPHSRRRGEQILCRFERAPAWVLRWREWAALALRRTGFAFVAGSQGSFSHCPPCLWRCRASGARSGCEGPAIAASHVDDDLVSPGKSQITDNERALVSCT